MNGSQPLQRLWLRTRKRTFFPKLGHLPCPLKLPPKLALRADKMGTLYCVIASPQLLFACGPAALGPPHNLRSCPRFGACLFMLSLKHPHKDLNQTPNMQKGPSVRFAELCKKREVRRKPRAVKPTEKNGGDETDPKRTQNGPKTDRKRTENGRKMDRGNLAKSG